jgi:hypothetical protein
MRWRQIKSAFSRQLPSTEQRSLSRIKKASVGAPPFSCLNQDFQNRPCNLIGFNSETSSFAARDQIL